MGGAAVGEDHVERVDVVDRRAVHDRVRPSGVRRGHPADRALPLRRRIGSEVQVLLRGQLVERPPARAGLHARHFALRVDPLDRVERRAVDLQSGADALSGEGGPGAPRCDRDADLPAYLHRDVKIVGVLRTQHSHRQDPVRRRIGRVQLARHAIDTHRPFRPPGERACHIGRRSHGESMPGGGRAPPVPP